MSALVQVEAANSLAAGSPAGGEPGAGAETRNEILWQRLQPFPRKARRFLVKMGTEYQATSFCLYLCDRCEQMAGQAAGEALTWARLAREVAKHVPEEAGFRTRLAGLALGFWAAALRVKGKLRAAEEAFAHARMEWEAGSDPEGRLPGWRLDDLEASMRIEQERFAEALALLDRALATAPPKATVAGCGGASRGWRVVSEGHSSQACEPGRKQKIRSVRIPRDFLARPPVERRADRIAKLSRALRNQPAETLSNPGVGMASARRFLFSGEAGR